MKKIRIMCAVGARPNFIRIAPLLRALKRYRQVEAKLVHTGPRYHPEMSSAFFNDLGLPDPDVHLEVGSGSHGWQTGMIMEKFEALLLGDRPDLVVVVGAVDSTLACALAAVKLHIQVAHVEAGLRSYNRKTPEETNRVLTDRLGDFLFTASREAGENLRWEGIEKDKIFFVGNVMIDSLREHLKAAEHRSRILEKLKLTSQGYAALTLHRPEAVDDRSSLRALVKILAGVGRLVELVYPIHPRIRKRLEEFGLLGRFGGIKGLKPLSPLGYFDFLKLMAHARLVLTDSGGIQEETTVLGVPCLTLRTETERPVTVTEGTNTVVGLDEKRIMIETRKVLRGKGKRGRVPELWDGKAADRIARILVNKM